MVERANLIIRVASDDDGYRATEPGSDPVGTGPTAHDAVIDYVERAREASQETQASD